MIGHALLSTNFNTLQYSSGLISQRLGGVQIPAKVGEFFNSFITTHTFSYHTANIPITFYVTIHYIYVMHLQDRLLSCQLRPTFPPGWKESEYHSLNGAVHLGRNPDSSRGLRPQPIRGLPAIEPRPF